MTELTVAEVLERTRQAYATCRTYRDEGVVTTWSRALGPKGRHRARRCPFWTAFVRPDRFRFEWAQATAGPEDEWDRMVILANAEGVRSSWTTRPGIRTHESIHEALPCATGISGASAYLVPSLLLPGRKGGDALPVSETAVLRAREEAEGRPCFALECPHPFGGRRVLWIACDDFLLRRVLDELEFDEGVLAGLRKRIEDGLRSASEPDRKIQEQALEQMDRTPPKPFRGETTIHYEPIVDGPVEPPRFETPRAWTEPPETASIPVQPWERRFSPLSPSSVPPAADVLARVREAYGSCRSYRDKGLVATVFVHDRPSPRRHTVKKPFSTEFIRPERFRFEYSEDSIDPDEEWQHMLILWNDEGFRSWWTFQPGIRSYDSFRDAIGQAAGVSGGSSCLVPCLLLPGFRDWDPLPSNETTEVLGSEEVAGHDCLVLRGELERGQERTLWIGRSDSLVRRVEETHVFDDRQRMEHVASMREELKRASDDRSRKVIEQAIEHSLKQRDPFRTEETFTFEPELDAAIPPERFATPDYWRET